MGPGKIYGTTKFDSSICKGSIVTTAGEAGYTSLKLSPKVGVSFLSKDLESAQSIFIGPQFEIGTAKSALSLDKFNISTSDTSLCIAYNYSNKHSELLNLYAGVGRTESVFSSESYSFTSKNTSFTIGGNIYIVGMSYTKLFDNGVYGGYHAGINIDLKWILNLFGNRVTSTNSIFKKAKKDQIKAKEYYDSNLKTLKKEALTNYQNAVFTNKKHLIPVIKRSLKDSLKKLKKLANQYDQEYKPEELINHIARKINNYLETAILYEISPDIAPELSKDLKHKYYLTAAVLYLNLGVFGRAKKILSKMETIGEMSPAIKKTYQQIMEIIKPTKTPQKGTSFPNLKLSQTGKNEKVTLTEVTRDHKITLVVFWEKWCSACKVQINTLQKIDDSDVAIVGVSSAHTKIDLKGKSSYNAVETPKNLSIKTIPMTFVLNSEGKVINTINGAVSSDYINGIIMKYK